MAETAAQLQTVGAALSEANEAAAPKTVAVLPAAADEVSASIAQLFSRYAQDYHAAAGQAAVYGEQFAGNLNASAASYASAEASNVIYIFDGPVAHLVIPLLNNAHTAFSNTVGAAFRNWFYYEFPKLFNVLPPSVILIAFWPIILPELILNDLFPSNIGGGTDWNYWLGI